MTNNTNSSDSDHKHLYAGFYGGCVTCGVKQAPTPHSSELDNLVNRICERDISLNKATIKSEIEALIASETRKAVEEERRMSLSLNDRSKIDRIIALAEKAGYEKAVEEYKKSQITIQGNIKVHPVHEFIGDQPKESEA